MGDQLTIRPLESAADLLACVALQRATWGQDFREGVPPALLQVAQKVSGIALGAFDAGGALVGFVFGLTGIKDGRLAHWSHMLAVRDDHRDRGIGRQLKLAQRERLLALKVERVFWTFDPLVARNAHLNLNRLGATVAEYVPDMYGADPLSPTDTVIGTDRFVVEWPLQALPNKRPPGVPPATGPLLTVDDEAMPLPDAATVRVAIPADVQQLKQSDPDLARRWRQVTRRAFMAYLSRGYRVVAFVPEGERGAYVLRRDAAHV